MLRLKGQKVDFFSPIRELFPTGNDYPGEVGIEVEVEGEHLLMVLPSYWAVHPDGSLRGESAEYVLLKPCKRESVLPKLKYLRDRIEKHGSKLQMSLRTSVHIHLNVSDWTLKECFQLIALYLIFEPLLVNIAGPHRVGNLFCLRAVDAEGMIDMLAQSVATRRFGFDEQQSRYAALNVNAVTKFNSLEFRALRGTVEPDVISEWVELLLCMKDAARGYPTPVDILGEFSLLGAENFCRKIFPRFAEKFLGQPRFDQQMWESARLMQQIVYAWDWKPEEKPKRLFVRDEAPALEW